MSVVFREKDAAKVAAGRAGARARWSGERRVVRVDSLAPAVRAAVLALVAADTAAKAIEPDAGQS